MPEIIIKYKTQKTLEALKDFAKYFNFSIANSKDKKKNKLQINGVAIIAGNSLVNVSELESVFSNKNINARMLRNQSWHRTK